MDWTPFDFALAAALVGGSGLLLVLAMRRPASVAYRGAAAALGVIAIVVGEADDAPGLVLFGLLLLVVTVALTRKSPQRSV